MKEFLNRMQIYRGKEENSKKKFRHLKNDLKVFGKVIHNLERIIVKFSHSFAELKPVKEAAILFFFQIVTQNLVENSTKNKIFFLIFPLVLADIKYESNINLITDFFARLYSPFMLIVFDSILCELKELQNLPIFAEINQSNVILTPINFNKLIIF